jgi:hypothetical protein
MGAAAEFNNTAIEAEQHQSLDTRVARADMKQTWALGYIGIPPRRNIYRLASRWWSPFQKAYKYQRDDSECQGQYVYIVENQFDASHPVCLGTPKRNICGLSSLTHCSLCCQVASKSIISVLRDVTAPGTMICLPSQSIRQREHLSLRAKPLASAA